MTARQWVRAAATAAALTSIVLVGMVISSTWARADEEDKESSEVRIGFEIAPVHLNLAGKNRELVGLGSYIVNGQADCNGCHTLSPVSEFAPGGNPYFNQPTVVNPDTYLGGGMDFGTLDPKGLSAHIVSRNLTPDKTGRPEGGHTFSEFVQIIRHGTDFDHLHPTCAGGVLNPVLTPSCVPAPFDGDLLQIMPWPTFSNMTYHDLRAIYEYLGAIPCVEGPPAPSILHNDCK